MNSPIALNTTKPAWESIEALVEGVPGWTPLDQLYTLFLTTLLSAELEGDIVEVGSWCGRSAVVLAAAAKAAGNSKIYCIDLFPEKNDWKQNGDGTYSFEVQIGSKRYGGNQVQTVWKEPFETQTSKPYEVHERLYDYFNETISRRGMTDVVRPHRGDLTSFIEHAGLQFKCRLAFLDGDHGFESVYEDIRNIDRCLVPGGWICFDDAFTTYEGVNRAITELIINNPKYERCQQMTRKLFIARKKAIF